MHAHKTIVSPAWFSLKLQLPVCIVLSFLSAFVGSVHAYSVAFGAMAYILPNLYFTYYAFRFSGKSWVYGIKNSFIWGEMGKLSLAMLLIAVVFRYIDPIRPDFFFLGYIVFIVLQWPLARYIAEHYETKHPE